MDLYTAIRNVAVQVPEAPEPFVVQQYLDAAREFFEKTQAWRDSDVLIFRDNYASRDNTGAFQLEPTNAEAEIIDATIVQFDDRMLEKQTTVQMQRRTGRCGQPRFFRIARGARLLHVAPDPGDANQLSGEFVLLPSRGAQGLDDELVSTYGEAIELGALYRLLRQPHQQWTDVEAAKVYGAEFANALDVWRRRATDDGMVGVGRKVRYGGY